MHILTIIAVLILSFSLAFADGDCPSRPATGPERSTYASVSAAVLAAVPPAPRDLVRADTTAPGGGERMPDCPGGNKEAPYRYQFRFRYELDRDVQARTAQSAMQDAMKGTPEQQAKKAALDAKHEDLMAQRKDARKSGDREAAERIKEEIRAVDKERDRVNDEIMQAYLARVQSGEMAKAMAGSAPARTDAEVTVFVNADRAWMPKGSEALSMPGADHAFWRSGDGGSLVMLVGSWDLSQPTVRAGLRNAGIITQAQALVVEIRAERRMAEKLARDMNLELLTKQLRAAP